jgi:lysozyme family protein
LANFSAWWALCMAPNNDGRADDTADDGAGATRWGWTIPTWQDARRFAGLPMSNALFTAMTQAQAGALAQVYHWNRLGGRRLNSGPDVSLIDWAWTSGGAIHEVQYQLGIESDGYVGPETIRAINTCPAFSDQCCYWRQSYYDTLNLRPRFPGLYRRATDVLALAHKLEGVA